MIHLIGHFSSAFVFWMAGRKGVSMFNVQMVVLSHWNLEGILFFPIQFCSPKKKSWPTKKKAKHMPGRTASSFAQALGFLTPFQHIRNGTSQIHHFIASSTLVLPLNAHTWDVFALGEAQQMGKLHLGDRVRNQHPKPPLESHLKSTKTWKLVFFVSKFIFVGL